MICNEHTAVPVQGVQTSRDNVEPAWTTTMRVLCTAAQSHHATESVRRCDGLKLTVKDHVRQLRSHRGE